MQRVWRMVGGQRKAEDRTVVDTSRNLFVFASLVPILSHKTLQYRLDGPRPTFRRRLRRKSLADPRAGTPHNIRVWKSRWPFPGGRKSSSGVRGARYCHVVVRGGDCNNITRMRVLVTSASDIVLSAGIYVPTSALVL